jgi:2-keto-3-deoxy-L-rhamnonate aldolase RhmA
MIETRETYNNLDKIIAVEGIGGVFQSDFRCDTVGQHCDFLILKLL